VLALAVPDLAVVLAGMVVAGFVGPWVSVAGVTAFQRRTPAAKMGRVFGVLRLVLTIPQAASVGIGAALITVVSYRVLLAATALTAAASGLLVIGQQATRRRAVPGTARPDAVASDSAGAAPARQSENRDERAQLYASKPCRPRRRFQAAMAHGLCGTDAR